MVARMENRQGKLKIGLLVNGPQVDAYVYDLVAWAVRQPELEVSHYVVLEGGKAAGAQGRWRKLFGEIAEKGFLETLRRRIQGNLFKFLHRSEIRSFKRSGMHREFLESRDLRDLVSASLELNPIVSPSGFVYRLDAADLEKLRAEKFDVLLRFCDCILKGGILDSARHGVISFHHGDNRVNRGGPAAFWEVYHRQPVTGFIIQRLSEELDGGEVLFRGWTQTQISWLRNQATLFRISYYYMRKVLKDMAARGGAAALEEAFPYSHPLYRTPQSPQIINYLFRKYRYSLMDRLRRKLRHEPRWGVACLPGSWRSAVFHRGRIIEAPAGHFIADPFVIHRHGRDYVFVEDLDFATYKGTITVYEIKAGEARLLGTALEEPFHLSFPYLFEFAGELYMCPESSAAKDIRLYRCVDFPLRWELVRVMFSGVGATDTLIFERDGLWWLFTNEDVAGAGDFSYQLAIYYAEDPVSSAWQPHPANPIYVDPRRARNGGLLRDGDTLYRVNQRQDIGTYGRAAGINRIKMLDMERYEEERVCEIEPQFLPGIHAAHHLHGNSRYTVFDFCRWENPYRERQREVMQESKLASQPGLEPGAK